MRKTIIGIALATAIGLNVPTLAAQPASLRQGIQYYNKGYVEKAIPLLEKAASRHPKNEDAFLWLARAYKKQGDPASLEKARMAYERVIGINPDNVEALAALGEMLSWNPGARSRGIDLLSRAVLLAPDNIQAARALTDALYWDNRLQEALEYAAPIAETMRDDSEWTANYADILTKTGHADKAVAVYEDILNVSQSDDLSLQLNYALALYQDNRRQEAAMAYEAVKPRIMAMAGNAGVDLKLALSGLAFEMNRPWDVIEIDQSLPDHVLRQKGVQLRIARALVKTYRIPEAIDIFQRLYEADLLSASEKIEYADYVKSLGLPPESLPQPNIVEALYQEALLAEPGNVTAMHRLATLYAARGEFDNAVQMYQQAIAAPSPSQEQFTSEYLDYLKSYKGDLSKADALFQQLLAGDPGNYRVKGAYAEFLSYQPAYRSQAIRVFLELSQEDMANQALWLDKLDQTLAWHQPSTDLVPLYQEVINVYPERKSIWLAIARAYRNNPAYYNEALDLYNRLMARHPEDNQIRAEWAGLLMTYEDKREEAMAILKDTISRDPNNLIARNAYGKLLSYSRDYDDAIDQFDYVLSVDPENTEALLAKGYTLIWSGRKLEAKDHFIYARSLHPNDVDVALGLAQANKRLGRYDEAFEIIEEIRHIIEPAKMRGTPLDTLRSSSARAFVLAAGWRKQSPFSGDAVSDVSILPVRMAAETTEETVPLPAEGPATGYNDPAMDSLQADVDALNQAIEALNALQASSERQLDRIETELSETRDAIPEALMMTAIDESAYDDALAATKWLVDDNDVYSGSGGLRRGLGGGLSTLTTENLSDDGSLALYNALAYDTNPLLSGLGRFRNDDLYLMEEGLMNDLRPLLRFGYHFFTQEGEPTTSKFRFWGFPNQAALSLTPQVRLRFGVNPYKYYIPSSQAPEPNETWSQDYAFGTTIRASDKLTIDGDVSIIHYNQSDSVNVDYRAGVGYQLNDYVGFKIGSFRTPQYNSLLAVAGLEPVRGPFDQELLGQVRETGLFLELNTHPFNHNFDLNLGYEWAHVGGHNVPDNTKNLLFGSMGYTWHYAQHHKVRAGYEVVWFGYDKNATNGFFDVTSRGITDPVVTLNPVFRADDGYVFGGYYSPEWFLQNAWRLDFRGYFWNKLIEYKLGGSLGFQNFELGHGIDEPDPMSLTSSFDLNMIMNLTDWLALYGNVDYTDAGGAFERWRFGGGMIVRPDIDGLSPVFGGYDEAP